MSGVPYTFANATTSIPLSQLDVNFATPATLGNTTVGLGNTVTVIGNLTLTNPTLSNLSSNITFQSGSYGVNFNNSSQSGNTTSTLLNDYETGTWTVTDASGAGLTFTNATGQYTKIGNMVYFAFDLNFPSTANTANVLLNLPFTSANTGGPAPGGGAQTYNPVGTYTWYVGSTQATLHAYTVTGTGVTNVTFSGKEIAVTGVYKVNF